MIITKTKTIQRFHTAKKADFSIKQFRILPCSEPSTCGGNQQGAAVYKVLMVIFPVLGESSHGRWWRGEKTICLTHGISLRNGEVASHLQR